MRGILKAGPAMDPLRLMYMTANHVSAILGAREQPSNAANLDRRL